MNLFCGTCTRTPTGRSPPDHTAELCYWIIVRNPIGAYRDSFVGNSGNVASPRRLLTPTFTSQTFAVNMQIKTVLFIAIAAGSASSAYLVPPHPRTLWDQSKYNVDYGVNYIDVNGDSLVDIVQAYENNGSALRTWLNTGCQFVDSSKVTPASPLQYCDIPTAAAHALEDARVKEQRERAKRARGFAPLHARRPAGFDLLCSHRWLPATPRR